MRTSERIIFALILGATSVAVPASAFDGAPANQDATIPMVVAQPGVGATAFPFDPNHFTVARIPAHTEGRFAIVTNVGSGCDGRKLRC